MSQGCALLILRSKGQRTRSWRMVISPPPVKPEGTIGLHSVCPSVSLSVRQSVCLSHSFSGLFLAMLSHILMKLVGSFYMKSYRSSSTFVTVDLLFHELLPFIKKFFQDISRLCFHISSDWEGKGPCAIVPLTWKMAHKSLCRIIRNGPLKISKSLKKAENGPFGKNLFPITAYLNKSW